MTYRRAARACALAAITYACAALPATAGAAVGALAPLPGADQCVTGGVGLTPTGPDCRAVTGLRNGSHRVVMSPDGRHVYAQSPTIQECGGGAFGGSACGNQIPGALVVLARDPQTGALSGVTCYSESGCDPSLGTPSGEMAITPDGKQLIVANPSHLSILTRDSASGTLSQGAGSRCVTSSSSLTECVQAPALPGGLSVSIAISADGRDVYVSGRDRVALLRRSSDGVFSPNAVQPSIAVGGEALVSDDGENLYLFSEATQTIRFFRRDPVNGTLSHLPPEPDQPATPETTSRCITRDDADPEPRCLPVRLIGDGDFVVADDGAHAYVTDTSPVADTGAKIATITTLARTSTGRLMRSRALSLPQGSELTRGLAIAPDGRSLYVAARAPAGNATAPFGILAFARDLSTGGLAALAGVERCYSANGSGGACTVAAAAKVGSMILDPGGANLYGFNGGQVANGATSPLAVFSRTRPAESGGPVVGRAALRPKRSSLKAGRFGTLRLTWAHPRRWRDLDSVHLRLRDSRGTVAWIRFDQEKGTLRLLRADGASGPSGKPGADRTLQLGDATIDLRASRAQGSGPKGKTVTLALALRLGRKPAGRTLTAEMLATDDNGRREGFVGVGRVRVRG